MPITESAILKPRSGPTRSNNLRVRFKHPIEEDDMTSSHNIDELSHIDPETQMYAGEIFAAKLMEGYYINGNGEKCTNCQMPLMVRDDVWDIFCGQWAGQPTGIGVCVVCPNNEDDDESNVSSHNDEKEYIHYMPSFPDDDTEEDSNDSHDESVGEFQKKVVVSKMEMNTDDDEICVNDLNTSDGNTECKDCPSCGMEMLNFGEDFECPFCALQIIKEELGIAEVGISCKGKNIKRNENEQDIVQGMHLAELVTVSSSCSTLSVSIKSVEEGLEKLVQDALKTHDAGRCEDASIVKTSSGGSTQLVINALLGRLREAKKAHEVPHGCQKTSTYKNNSDLSQADLTQVPVNDVLKRLITGFWMENKEEIPSSTEVDCFDIKHRKEEQNATNIEAPIQSEKMIPVDNSINDDLHHKVKALAAMVFGTEEGKADMVKSNKLVIKKEGCDSLNIPKQANIEGNGNLETQKPQIEDEIPNVSYADKDKLTCEEEIILSTVDPPSVCSQNSRRDSSRSTTNTEDSVDKYLLRSHPESIPALDSRDPPTTFSDKYQTKLRLISQDQSEDGGSLKFHRCFGDSMANTVYPSCNIANQRLQSQNEVAIALNNARLHQKCHSSTCVKPAVVTSQPWDPIKSVPNVKKTTPRDRDLYRPPKFITEMVNESESSSDAMIRQRLMHLEARHKKLSLRHSNQSDNSESELQARTQCSDNIQSLVCNPIEHQVPNVQSVFREQRFTFDNIDLHQATSASASSSCGLSPRAIARHEHYKKQLFSTEKKCNNDSNLCLSPSAVQRHQHYKEVLKGHHTMQGPHLVTQE